jgi:hypothetical protein
VEVAEYAVAQSIDNEPAFVWWVPYTLKKRNRITASVSNRYNKREFKYGFRVPKTVEEAKEIDKGSGNTLWIDSVERQMDAVRQRYHRSQRKIPDLYDKDGGLSKQKSLYCRWPYE